jgi:uncharacterized protein YegP (UPF0339 family)
MSERQRADADRMWVIDIHLDRDGAYRWRLWSQDGRAASASLEGFAARANAQRQARRFHDDAREMRYEVLTDGSGQFVWRAADADGTPVARSAAGFDTHDEAAKHAESVRRYAGGARVP